MKRVLDNAIVLYGEELEPVHGHVVVKDGFIEEVGEGSYIGPKEDVKRGIISPSFTNAHVHLGDAGGMDEGAYLPLQKRVGRGGVKYGVHSSPLAERAMRKSLEAMRASGTTAFCDFREGGRRGVELLKSLLNMPARILGRPEQDENVFEFSDGFGISSVSDYTWESLVSILRRRGDKLVAAHAAELRDDVEEALRIEPDFLVHLTNASLGSLEKVFRKRVPIVLCARANASFGAGIPNLKAIFQSPCAIGLGTDNVFANQPSMLREMEFVWKLYRGLYKDASFDAKRVLRAATVEGRRILRLPSNAVEEGNRADFLVTRALQFEKDPALALVHRMESSDIRETLC